MITTSGGQGLKFLCFQSPGKQTPGQAKKNKTKSYVGQLGSLDCSVSWQLIHPLLSFSWLAELSWGALSHLGLRYKVRPISLLLEGFP